MVDQENYKPGKTEWIQRWTQPYRRRLTTRRAVCAYILLLVVFVCAFVTTAALRYGWVGSPQTTEALSSIVSRLSGSLQSTI